MIGIVLFWLVSSGARANELPGPTEPPKPREGKSEECQPVDLRPGQRLPSWLLDDDGRVTCRGTVVPPSELLTLYDIENWAEAEHKRFTLSHTTWTEREMQYKLRIADLAQPTPWHATRDANRAWGAIAALGAATSIIWLADRRYTAWRTADATRN